MKRFFILTGIGDKINSTVGCNVNSSRNVRTPSKCNKLRGNDAESMFNFLFFSSTTQQPECSRFVTIVKQQHKLDEVSYHKLFDILKQYQKEVNELRAERMAKNANPLALDATFCTKQTSRNPYLSNIKTSQIICKPNIKSFKPSNQSMQLQDTKAKEISQTKSPKKSQPPSESASEEDSDPEQAQKDKDIARKIWASHCKMTIRPGQFWESKGSEFVGAQEKLNAESQTVKRLYVIPKEKMLLCVNKLRKVVKTSSKATDVLADTYE
ncbi:hypothetical protein Tco_0968576 [Tanacetum coccineum]